MKNRDIVEIFGIPGSGKTFYAKSFAEKNDYRLFLYYLFSNKWNLLFKIFVHCKLSYLIGHRINKILLKIYKPFFKNENQFGFNVKLKNYIYQLVYLYLFEKYFTKKHIRIVYDEGIIHHLIGIEAEFDIDHSVSLKAYQALNTYPTTKIFISTNVKTAKERIKFRNRKFSSMDYLSEDLLEQFLTRYNDVCNQFLTEIDGVKIINND